jgi:uncharacterized protein YqgC (DUF456 family)
MNLPAWLDPQITAWTALCVGFLLAAIGSVVPGLPGALFVVLGALVHKWLLPGLLSHWGIGLLVALALLAWLTDFLATTLGAKLGGATRWGMIGAACGGFIGIFFGPPGLLLGPFLGAIGGDLYAKRTELKGLLKAGAGATLGVVLAMVLRLAILCLMLLVVLVDLLV